MRHIGWKVQRDCSELLRIYSDGEFQMMQKLVRSKCRHTCGCLSETKKKKEEDNIKLTASS